MKFNDVTDNAGLIQSCEFWTGLGLAQISGDTAKLKEFTRLINNNYHKVVTAILESMDGWDFDDPNHANTSFIKSYNLVSGQQYVSFPLSDKILKIKRVEISYDNTNWYKAEPMDINEFTQAVSQTTNISNSFTKSDPYYDLVGNYLYLYPIPDLAVTSGLKLWVSREVDEFTSADTTQEPGIDEPFHEMIAVGASLDYALAKGLSTVNNLATKYADYEPRLRRYYSKKEDDRQLILKSSAENYE